MDDKSKILEVLRSKSLTKQMIHDNTANVFTVLKTVLTEIAAEINHELSGLDQRILLEFKDNGKAEAQLRIAGDLLIFSMHSNVFEFNREHNIQKTSFAAQNPLNTYCGIINIYNFLADSFKFNREEDLGYLIGRIFINRDFYYMVEGKGQLAFTCNMLGTEKIDRAAIRKIVIGSIQYALDFDLLVPPYDQVKIATVAQMIENIENSKMQTGKRLGFVFNSDDINGVKNHR
ncbi:MAG TPA: hypothetical protein PK252_05635 [Bacteroidales bacterium]|nr:hypothetical protein [Bacteroidales bacterium]